MCSCHRSTCSVRYAHFRSITAFRWAPKPSLCTLHACMLLQSYLTIGLLSLHMAYRAGRYPEEAILLQSGYPLSTLHRDVASQKARGDGDVTAVDARPPAMVVHENFVPDAT